MTGKEDTRPLVGPGDYAVIDGVRQVFNTWKRVDPDKVDYLVDSQVMELFADELHSELPLDKIHEVLFRDPEVIPINASELGWRTYLFRAMEFGTVYAPQHPELVKIFQKIVKQLNLGAEEIEGLYHAMFGRTPKQGNRYPLEQHDENAIRWLMVDAMSVDGIFRDVNEINRLVERHASSAPAVNSWLARLARTQGDTDRQELVVRLYGLDGRGSEPAKLVGPELGMKRQSVSSAVRYALRALWRAILCQEAERQFGEAKTREDKLAVPLDILDLDEKAFTAFRRSGKFTSLGDLVRPGARSVLRRYQVFGPRRIIQLETELAKLGLELG